jgi:hypothetical protein
MRTTIFSIVAVALLAGMTTFAFAAQAADQDGAVSLFDGKTLDGWNLMNGAKFSVEDGVIKLNGGSGWLRSDKEYSDFVLRLELRFMKPKQDGGVFMRASMAGGEWPDERWEVQCENTRRMAKLFGPEDDPEHKRNIDLTQKVLKPDGEWNQYEIKLVGPSIEVRLNGELVTTSDDLGAYTRGYIGLQGEGGIHEYRNIRIVDLSK